MPFRLYKMGLEAKVAVANMALINCALAIILYDVHIQSEGSRAAAEIAQITIAVLGCPAGWFSLLGAGTVSGPPAMAMLLAMIFLPLNAYVWGKTVEVIVRRHKAHRDRRLSGDQESPCP